MSKDLETDVLSANGDRKPLWMRVYNADGPIMDINFRKHSGGKVTVQWGKDGEVSFDIPKKDPPVNADSEEWGKWHDAKMAAKGLDPPAQYERRLERLRKQRDQGEEYVTPKGPDPFLDDLPLGPS